MRVLRSAAFLESVAEDAGAWVAQQYVHRPLLYVGERKFDIRCWVVVEPDYTVLLYKEGVLRVGAASYDLDDISNIRELRSFQTSRQPHAESGRGRSLTDGVAGRRRTLVEPLPGCWPR